MGRRKRNTDERFPSQLDGTESCHRQTQTLQGPPRTHNSGTCCLIVDWSRWCRDHLTAVWECFRLTSIGAHPSPEGVMVYSHIFKNMFPAMSRSFPEGPGPLTQPLLPVSCEPSTMAFDDAGIKNKKPVKIIRLQCCFLGFFGGILFRMVDLLSAWVVIAAGWGCQPSTIVKYGVLLVLSQLLTVLYLSASRAAVQKIRERRHLLKKVDVCDDDTDRLHSSVLQEQCGFYFIVSFLCGIILGSYLTWVGITAVLGQPLHLFPLLVSCTLDLMICTMLGFLYQLKNHGSANPDITHDEEEESVWHMFAS
jgi:hypothetical protein